MIALRITALLASFVALVALPARANLEATAARPTLVVGRTQVYEAQAGDSLTSVGARFGVDVPTLARMNQLAPTAWLALGQELTVENPHVVPFVTDFPLAPATLIVINVPQRMLFRFQDGEVTDAYPVAAGRETWRTPLGEFAIDERAMDKTWFVPLSIQEEMQREGKPVVTTVPPGPDNPLGRYWLGMSDSSCGIHSTIVPPSIYGLRTHGCIRLHPDDAAALFENAGVGDRVRIIYEPYLLAELPDGRVCLEAHGDAYGRAPAPEAWLQAIVAERDPGDRIDLDAATGVVAALEGIARDVTKGGKGGSCL